MSNHEHRWNPKTLICTSCGISYREAWNEWAKRPGEGNQGQKLPPITQLKRGAKA